MSGCSVAGTRGTCVGQLTSARAVFSSPMFLSSERLAYRNGTYTLVVCGCTPSSSCLERCEVIAALEWFDTEPLRRREFSRRLVGETMLDIGARRRILLGLWATTGSQFHRYSQTLHTSCNRSRMVSSLTQGRFWLTYLGNTGLTAANVLTSCFNSGKHCSHRYYHGHLHRHHFSPLFDAAFTSKCTVEWHGTARFVNGLTRRCADSRASHAAGILSHH